MVKIKLTHKKTVKCLKNRRVYCSYFDVIWNVLTSSKTRYILVLKLKKSQLILYGFVKPVVIFFTFNTKYILVHLQVFVGFIIRIIKMCYHIFYHSCQSLLIGGYCHSQTTLFSCVDLLLTL